MKTTFYEEYCNIPFNFNKKNTTLGKLNDVQLNIARNSLLKNPKGLIYGHTKSSYIQAIEYILKKRKDNLNKELGAIKLSNKILNKLKSNGTLKKVISSGSNRQITV